MVSLEMRGFYALTDDVIDAMVNETSPSDYCLNGGRSRSSAWTPT